MRWWLLLLVLLVGCRATKPPSPPVAVAPPSAFSPSLLVDLGLETTASAKDPRFVFVCNDAAQGRALLWSAEIGVNLGPYGFGRDFAGADLASFATKAYSD